MDNSNVSLDELYFNKLLDNAIFIDMMLQYDCTNRICVDLYQ